MAELPWALVVAMPQATAFLELGLGEPISRGQSQQALGQGRGSIRHCLLKMLIFVLCGLFLHSF